MTGSGNTMNWAATGLEHYLAGLHQGTEFGSPEKPIDFLIIGSGYGGSISAAEITRQSKSSVYLFERGTEFLPGMFPANTADLIGHIRLSRPGSEGPAGNPEGLFDVHADKGVSTVCANGLGGGSLINAGVMRRPVAEIFDSPRWPQRIDLQQLSHYYDEAELLLGSKIAHHEDHNGSVKDNIYSINARRHIPSKSEFLKARVQQAPAHHYQYEEAAITVSLQCGTNQSGVKQAACKACGDCATGCNHDAKNSLDTNLLYEAFDRGAKIHTGATVLRVERADPSDVNSLWIVHVVYTAKDMRLRDKGYQPSRAGVTPPHINVNTIYCKNVLLCAGTLGSTEILKRSGSADTRFSPTLGDHFSTNGDMLAFYDSTHLPPHGDVPRPLSVADQRSNPAKRAIGPTICGVVVPLKPGTADGDLRNDLLIEEMAVPGPLQPFVGVGVSFARTIRELAKIDLTTHSPTRDPARESNNDTAHTGIYAIMGDDGASGSLELETFKRQAASQQTSDGYLRVQFRDVGKQPLFSRQLRVLRHLLEPAGTSMTDTIRRFFDIDTSNHSHVFATPGWRIPGFLGKLFGRSNPHMAVTVHPLGGCAMAQSASTGVVNEFGQVFDAGNAAVTATLNGLYVLDGSIVPTALAANPALTISALTLRALRHKDSSLRQKITAAPAAQQPIATPQLAQLARPQFATQSFMGNRPTTFDVIERMSEKVAFLHEPEDGGEPQSVPKLVEVTLRMGPIDMARLYAEDPDDTDQNKLKVNTTIANNTGVISQIRIFDPLQYDTILNRYNNGIPLSREMLNRFPDDKKFSEILRNQTHLDQYLACAAEVTVLVSGHLEVFHRGQSSSLARLLTLRANNIDRLAFARLLMSVPVKKLFAAMGGKRSLPLPTLALLSHAGEQRYMTYRLKAEHWFINDTAATPASALVKTLRGHGSGGFALLTGVKTIAANRRRNLWRQLSQMQIEAFPGIDHSAGNKPLSLDLNLLSQLKIPLLRVAQQDQMINTKVALIALSGYLVRMLAAMQYPTIRLHNDNNPKISQPERTPVRFPGNIHGLPAHEQPIEIQVGVITEDRISDLPVGTPVKIRLTRYRQNSNKPPVLLLHGYSASGTTFTHNTLKTPFTRQLHNAGYDVWVLDMRTSCAMDTARYPWSFEDTARSDIPIAIDHVLATTGFAKLNVVAHCMGAAMFSMSVLGPWNPQLHHKINSAVLSQVTPVVRLREAGRFRAFISSYMKDFLPTTEYKLQPSGNTNPLERTADILLSTLPYPEPEARLEQSGIHRQADYQRTRRRLDLLYTRTFHLQNVTTDTLAQIDDLFGPLNLQTIAQSIHFAQQGWITDRVGRDLQLDSDIDSCLEKQWTFPTYAFVGRENSLFEPGALEEFRKKCSELRMRSEVTMAEPIPNYGHQDAFMANDANELVFVDVLEWLNRQPAPHKPAEPVEPTRSSPDKRYCYRVRGLAIKHNDSLTIRINKNNLFAAQQHAKPLKLGVWLEPEVTSGEHQFPLPDSFMLADYAAELAHSDYPMHLIDTDLHTLDNNDDYRFSIERADRPALFEAGHYHFFFETHHPISRAAEISPLEEV